MPNNPRLGYKLQVGEDTLVYVMLLKVQKWRLATEVVADADPPEEADIAVSPPTGSILRLNWYILPHSQPITWTNPDPQPIARKDLNHIKSVALEAVLLKWDEVVARSEALTGVDAETFADCKEVVEKLRDEQIEAEVNAGHGGGGVIGGNDSGGYSSFLDDDSSEMIAKVLEELAKQNVLTQAKLDAFQADSAAERNKPRPEMQTKCKLFFKFRMLTLIHR